MLLMLSSAAPAASLVSATNQFSFQTHVVPRQPSGAHHNMPLFQPTPAASIYSLAVGPSPQWRALLAGVESLDIFHPLPVFVSTLSFFLRINPIFFPSSVPPMLRDAWIVPSWPVDQLLNFNKLISLAIQLLNFNKLISLAIQLLNSNKLKSLAIQILNFNKLISLAIQFF